MASETNFESPRATALDVPSDISNKDDEAQLIAQASNGSAAAMEQLVERHERRLFRLAQNITSNHEDTEEVVQNAFFEVFLRLAAFRGDSRFYTWLVRIALNEAAQQNRLGSLYGTRNWY